MTFDKQIESLIAENLTVNNALMNRLMYADYKKPSAYEAFKYRVASKIKAAVRWATYWAWKDEIY